MRSMRGGLFPVVEDPVVAKNKTLQQTFQDIKFTCKNVRITRDRDRDRGTYSFRMRC
jgi:hypothetical protein